MLETERSSLSSIEPERAVEGGVGGALYCPVTTLCRCCGEDGWCCAADGLGAAGLPGDVESGEDEYMRELSRSDGGAARPSAAAAAAEEEEVVVVVVVVGLFGMLTGAVKGLGVLWEMVRTGVNWLCSDFVLFSLVLADEVVALEAVFVTTGLDPPVEVVEVLSVLAAAAVVVAFFCFFLISPPNSGINN